MLLIITYVTLLTTVALASPALALAQSQQQSSTQPSRRPFLLRNSGLAVVAASLTGGVATGPMGVNAAEEESQLATPTQRIQPIPKQYMAALVVDKNAATAMHGTGADQWGLWMVDPGPRGVLLQDSSAKTELVQKQ